MGMLRAAPSTRDRFARKPGHEILPPLPWSQRFVARAYQQSSFHDNEQLIKVWHLSFLDEMVTFLF